MNPSRYTKLDDYRDSLGNVDWKAYGAARKASGEECSSCGAFMIFNSGKPQRCVQCADVENDRRLHHDELVRCPACRHTWKPDAEDWDGPGQNGAVCPACNRWFIFVIHPRYSYESPPMGVEE